MKHGVHFIIHVVSPTEASQRTLTAFKTLGQQGQMPRPFSQLCLLCHTFKSHKKNSGLTMETLFVYSDMEIFNCSASAPQNARQYAGHGNCPCQSLRLASLKMGVVVFQLGSCALVLAAAAVP